jgi:hypothetical protein
MRVVAFAGSLVLLMFAALTFAADEPKGGEGARYGIAADLKKYPQGTPKEALASVLAAIDAGRFDYLVAQLADPAWVDDRVKRLYGGHFEQQVEETRGRLDPSAVKLLRRFLKDGEWTEDKDQATARIKGVEDRSLSFRKRDGRWFIENRDKGG